MCGILRLLILRKLTPHSVTYQKNHFLSNVVSLLKDNLVHKDILQMTMTSVVLTCS